jgi:hypothetical protein
LRRVLKVWDLVFYGTVHILPIMRVEIFGVAQKLWHVHFSTVVPEAMAAMMLAAFGYGWVAGVCPSPGSD